MRCPRCHKNKSESITTYGDERYSSSSPFIYGCKCKYCGFSVVENSKPDMIESWRRSRDAVFEEILNLDEGSRFLYCFSEDVRYEMNYADECVYGVNFKKLFSDTDAMKRIKRIIKLGDQNCKNESFKEHQIFWDNSINDELFELVKKAGCIVRIAEFMSNGSIWDRDIGEEVELGHWVQYNGNYEDLYICNRDLEEEVVLTEDEYNEYCDNPGDFDWDEWVHQNHLRMLICESG